MDNNNVKVANIIITHHNISYNYKQNFNLNHNYYIGGIN